MGILWLQLRSSLYTVTSNIKTGLENKKANNIFVALYINADGFQPTARSKMNPSFMPRLLLIAAFTVLSNSLIFLQDNLKSVPRKRLNNTVIVSGLLYASVITQLWHMLHTRYHINRNWYLGACQIVEPCLVSWRKRKLYQVSTVTDVYTCTSRGEFRCSITVHYVR